MATDDRDVTMTPSLRSFCLLGLLATLVPVDAGATAGARDTCSKMQRDGRLGAVSLATCQCHYRVADKVLDADIKALLFDSWHNGTDNLAALEALTPRRRVRQQLATLEASLNASCQN